MSNRGKGRGGRGSGNVQQMESDKPKEEIERKEATRGEAEATEEELYTREQYDTQAALLEGFQQLLKIRQPPGGTQAANRGIPGAIGSPKDVVVNNKNDDKKKLEIVTTIKGSYRLGKSQLAWKEVTPIEINLNIPEMLKFEKDDILEIMKIFDIGKYLGLDVLLGRKKIWALAKKIDEDNPRKPIIQLLAMYCALGTSWVDRKRNTTISQTAQNMITLLMESFKLDTRLTDSGSVNALTVGRAVVCFPDLTARVMKTDNSRIVTKEFPGLPRYLHFPAARALILTTDEAMIQAHDDFSAEFQTKINRGRSIGSRSEDQKAYLAAALNSPLFSNEQRVSILKELAKESKIKIEPEDLENHSLFVGATVIEEV